MCYNVDMHLFTRLKNKIKSYLYLRKCQKLVLYFPILCKVHGVKFSDRQGAIAQSHAGDKLQLVHVPKDVHPFNVYVYSIPLNRILGYLEAGLSKKLVKLFKKDFCIDGAIDKITGESHSVLGCNLHIFDTRTMMSNVHDFSHLHGE